MSFYENTLIAKQDTYQNQIEKIKEKYSTIVKKSSGKVVKIEEWGLLNLSYLIKKNKKGFTYIINLKVI